ncbi:hypothetical protein PMAYCL1PPCAC_14409, partial [Pristionchus mayeri]
MRITCFLRAIIRSRDEALDDIKTVLAILNRYGKTHITKQAADAQPFLISSTNRPMPFVMNQLSKELAFSKDHPRPVKLWRKGLFQKYFPIDIEWIKRFKAYVKAKEAFASRDTVVRGSRDALSAILASIRNKDLSPLAPLLLDARILPSIEENREQLSQIFIYLT